jgi:hypothetical protein
LRSYILSCKNEIKQDLTSVEAITNADTLAIVDTTIQKYPIWILEFQRLRQAVYQNDLPVIKSFFDFPLSNEQANGLLAVINFNTKRFKKNYQIAIRRRIYEILQTNISC